MKFLPAIKLIAACAVFTGATAGFAQHSHAPGKPHASGSASVAAPTPGPYAGRQIRSIKALSDMQTQDLLAGKGMELALSAELNGYPGPMHTLELAQPLALSPAQQRATQELMERHKSEARRLGTELVEAERALDQAFLSRKIDAASLSAHTEKIGKLQTALRLSHLQTHLQQTALLTPTQIGQYAELRGYVDSKAGATTPAHKH